jgi:hypothetical protein
LTSTDGPTKTAIKVPSREPTASETFTFTGYWVDENGVKYYMPDAIDGTPAADAIDMTTFVPMNNMTFYPEYDTKPREYMVKFYDWEGKLIP